MSKSRSNSPACWYLSPFIKQCFVTGAVCSNTIGYGCAIGFPAVLLPQLHEQNTTLHLTTNADSWITSVMGISLLFGNFIIPTIMGRFGRKLAHYAVSIPGVAGWFTMIFFTSFEALMVGRILLGLSFGMLLPLRAVLIAEYTSPVNRGAFLTTISLAQTFGIFFVHLIGSLLSWQQTALVCAFFSFTSLVMTIYSPESPSWLAARGRYYECRTVFKWLRGDDEDDELEEMILARLLMEQHKIREKMHKRNRFTDFRKTIQKKEFHKPIILMCHAFFMLQVSGGTTMASYSTKILGAILGPNASINFWMIVLDTQRLISNTIAIYFISKIKRRTMIFSVGSLSVVTHLAISGYVYVKSNGLFTYDAPWLPVLLLNSHVFTLATAMVPLPNVLAGEVFPLEYRSIGSGMSLVSLGVCSFIILKTMPGSIENIGLHGTYTIYAGILTYNLLIIWLLLPETKGKTLQQIEDEFRGRPLKPYELASRQSLQADPVVAYKRKMSERRLSALC